MQKVDISQYCDKAIAPALSRLAEATHQALGLIVVIIIVLLLLVRRRWRLGWSRLS